MNLAIFCNFQYPSIGGSEIVCKNIAEHMSRNGFNVTSFGFNVKKDFQHNNVFYRKCLKDNNFLDQIKPFDHILVYSDYFEELGTILKNISGIKAKITIVLLGKNTSIDSISFCDIIKKNLDKINIVCHDIKLDEYQACLDKNIPAIVIPNGVDISEFKNNTINFRKKYNIDTKYILLNVSNFFYGKNQEGLLEISEELSKKRSDFTTVFISRSFDFDKLRFNSFRKKIYNKNYKFKFKILRDIPREDVIGAFNQSDIFVFTTLKEVFPLVILESMAAGVPWISMNVGNVGGMSGGISIKNDIFDARGYKIFNQEIINEYVENIDNILDKKITVEKADIRKYDWNNICKKYLEIFNK